MKIMVISDVWRDGKKVIRVRPYDARHYDGFTRNLERFTKSGSVVDWQAAKYESVEDAKNGIMTQFGIGWFNMARKQLGAMGA